MLEQLLNGFEAMSMWEYVGVVFGLLYLILAMKQNIWCWAAAFISTLVYTLLFWQGALLMESALNLYYLAMAVYGWWQWRGASVDSSSPKVNEVDSAPTTTTTTASSTAATKAITSWSLNRHILIIVVTSVISLILGYVLDNHSHAQMAYLDSFTTCFAVITTYLVTQKVLENWLYWVVIDLASIYLYIEMQYLPTAALFVVYTVLAVQGYRLWRRELNEISDLSVGGEVKSDRQTA